jgi:aspartate beta-hydroxylase
LCLVWQNRAMCPTTSSFIGSIGANYDHAFFSAMAPRTHIAKHNGNTSRTQRRFCVFLTLG